MNPIAKDRLFNFRHAFDQRRVVWLVWLIVAIVALTPLLFVALDRLRHFTPELRKELWRRYFSWLVITPLVIGPVLLGGFWTILLVTVLSLLCYAEFARATGIFREKMMSLMVVLGILAIGFSALDNWYHLFVSLAPLTIVCTAAVALLADEPKGFIQRVGLASLSFLLFGVCLGHLGYFANDPDYRPILVALLTTVAMNDIFAFVVGKSIGGPKLCPNTSPNKTISGSLGALILSTGLFVLLAHGIFRHTSLNSPYHLIVMGAIISIAGQCGDLTISSIKRDVGIKDMGSIIPGHGGILDRCNSLLLSAPAIFHYVAYYQGAGRDQNIRIFTGG